MKQYLLSVFHPEGGTPPTEVLEEAMRNVGTLNQELMAVGAWVFAGGLQPSSAATVVRLPDGEVLTTDGPFTEGMEHIGGCWIIKAPDLNSALEWGHRATRVCRLPIEVRPLPRRGRGRIPGSGPERNRARLPAAQPSGAHPSLNMLREGQIVSAYFGSAGERGGAWGQALARLPVTAASWLT
jgi:hypothetical protein